MGYMFMRLDLDAAPLMLGFILGPMLEENFRRALLLSRGSFAAFFTRPISGTLLALIGIFVAWQIAAFFLQRQATCGLIRASRRTQDAGGGITFGRSRAARRHQSAKRLAEGLEQLAPDRRAPAGARDPSRDRRCSFRCCPTMSRNTPFPTTEP